MSDGNTIVVGVDGSVGGYRALQWAISEAARTDSCVEAVIAWDWDGIDGSLVAATSPEQERQEAERVLARQVDAVMAELTGSVVAVASEAVQGRAAPVLTRAARGARELVLGSHGHSRLRHAVLGSVAEECIRGAGCPVVVIPVPQPAPETAKASVQG